MIDVYDKFIDNSYHMKILIVTTLKSKTWQNKIRIDRQIANCLRLSKNL